ncbi:MAG: hypothetical protein ACXVJB_13030 [Mucilaginibacter sp.]
MKKSRYIYLLSVCFLLIFSCKKEARQTTTQQGDNFKNPLIDFSINGELLMATIDTMKGVITIVIPDATNKTGLTVNFELAAQFSATINNQPVTNGAIIDFSGPVTLTITSADKKHTKSFQVNVENTLQYFGVTGNIVSEKSLNKSYDFYFDQFDGSPSQAVNCGPTVTTMAIKWADSTFTGKPVDARNLIPEGGGWWFTSDIQNYLSRNGIRSNIDTLADVAALVKNSIDNNNLVILCLDMFSVPFNGVQFEHVQKFYQTSGPGWGHFLLVKGYKQTTTNFFLEIYDPYSDGQYYSLITTGQMKGKDRYYVGSDIQQATAVWWPYAIVLAPKGSNVASVNKLTVSSIHKAVPVASGK